MATKSNRRHERFELVRPYHCSVTKKQTQKAVTCSFCNTKIKQNLCNEKSNTMYNVIKTYKNSIPYEISIRNLS